MLRASCVKLIWRIHYTLVRAPARSTFYLPCSNKYTLTHTHRRSLFLRTQTTLAQKQTVGNQHQQTAVKNNNGDLELRDGTVAGKVRYIWGCAPRLEVDDVLLVCCSETELRWCVSLLLCLEVCSPPLNELHQAPTTQQQSRNDEASALNALPKCN